MRIIAGDKRGSKLQSLPGEETRPTLERVKEALFSAMHFLLPGAAVLDLYAGSGQLGLEALSRGALKCTFVDNSSSATEIIKQNVRSLGYLEKSLVICSDSKSFLRQCKAEYDIVMIDPPYSSVNWNELLPRLNAVTKPRACVFCESAKGTQFPEEVGELKLKKVYSFGAACIAKYQKTQIDE